MISSGPINATSQSPSLKRIKLAMPIKSLTESRPAEVAVEQDIAPDAQSALVESRTNLSRALKNLAPYNEPGLSERPSKPSDHFRSRN